MNTDRHFAADVWEKYALDMLSEADCESLEEHLLICTQCQDLLAEADEYIRVMRAGLTAIRAGSEEQPSKFVASVIRRRLRMSAVVAGAFSVIWLQ